MILIDKASIKQLKAFWSSRTEPGQEIPDSTLWRWIHGGGAERILSDLPRRQRKISDKMQAYEDECGKLIQEAVRVQCLDHLEVRWYCQKVREEPNYR